MNYYSNKFLSFIILTFVSPLFSLIAILASRDKRLLVPMGILVMTILGSVYIYLPGNDGHTHLIKTQQYYLDMGFGNFFNVFFELLLLNNKNAPPGISDPYLHTLAFLSGGVLGKPQLLHVFSSFVYGIIYFSIIRILYERLTWPKGASLILALFLCFFIYRGISGLNSIRWWTALWLMFYSFLAYWHYSKSKYLLLLIVAVYIHFSFLAFIFPALFAIRLFKNPKTLMIIWLLSFFVGANHNLIKPYIPELRVLQEKEKYNLDEDHLALVTKHRAKKAPSKQRFYKQLGESTFIKFSIPILIIITFFVRSKIYYRNKLLIAQLFAVGILLYSFGNIMEFAPSVHGRARAGASTFIMFAALLCLSEIYLYNRKFYQSIWLRLPIFLFFTTAFPMILFHLSYTINMLSAFALMMPVSSWILGAEDVSIRDMIVKLLP